MTAEVRPNWNDLSAPQDDKVFRQLAESIPTLCWMADREGYILWYNRRWYEYTGKSPAEMRGWGWQSVHDPEDLPPILERWKDAINSARPFEMIIPIIGRDGVKRPFLTRIVPAFDEQGALSNWFGVNTDVSLQVEAERALAKSEAKFRALADSMPQLVWSAAPDGRHDYHNARWFEYTGATSEACEGDGWMDLVHPDDRDRVSTAWRRAVERGEPSDCEHRFRFDGGNYRWVLTRAHPDRNAQGEVTRWYGAITDIEDLVKARLVLQRSRDELEAEVGKRTGERNLLARLVETTNLMVMAIDPHYRISAINASNAAEFERAYGVRASVGDNVLELLKDRPEALSAARERWGRALAGEDHVFLEARAHSGAERSHYEIKVCALRDAGGTLVGAFHIAEDITSRVRDQAKLARAQEALQQSQRLEAMGQLTGGVAHDFNNLLTPIIGSLDMLQRRGVGGERERRLVHGAFQSAERARSLVQRLLAFARRQPLQAVPVDIPALIHGLTDLVGGAIGPQIALRVEPPAEPMWALADQHQLEMAILNLCVNARDAMPGDGELEIAVDEAVIDANASTELAPGRYVKISVTDNGHGMDEETRMRAIEPFFSTKGIGKGTGLGLSMAHGLASQLGGALTIASALGQGTSVTLWLPECFPSAGGGDSVRPPEQRPSALGVVLVVDDEEFVRASTTDMLEELGYEPHEADSAEAALRMIDRGLRPDLLITDHLMPGMTGTKLAREVKVRLPEVGILLASGFAELDGVASELPCLTKPFLQRDLVSAIAGLHAGRRASKAT